MASWATSDGGRFDDAHNHRRISASKKMKQQELAA
jgi:hypothetical protein